MRIGDSLTSFRESTIEKGGGSVSVRSLIRDHYQEVMELLDCIKVGVYIGDGNGKTLFLNKESEKTGGMTRDELIGKTMQELIEIGYVTESSILKAIKSNKEESIIQELGEGGQLYITGVPLIRNGKVDLVVCTERDITETINLKELLREKGEIAEQYETELEYFRKRSMDSTDKMIYGSAEMKKIIEKVHRIARLETTVLLTGESGTGKELIASMIFQNSNRCEKPFFKINCAAIPENLLESEFFGYEKGAFTGANDNGKKGIFELSHGGTLFLDEIGDLPIHMQSKLLRVLQEKEIMRIGGKASIPIDVRVIAATNMNLRNAMDYGKFRKDLYYRINIIPIDVPPLRSRREDILPLTLYFIEKFNKQYKMAKSISHGVLEILENYEWPGNIRELSNVIERIMVGYDGARITKFQVQQQLVSGDAGEAKDHEYTGSLEEIMCRLEKKVLLTLMEKYEKASDVARVLNVNKSTISRKLRKYNIKSKG